MSQIYELKHPIKQTVRVQGGQPEEREIFEITVSRLNGGDIRWLENNAGKPGTTLGLLARLTKLDNAKVDLLDVEDITELSEIIEGFFASFPAGWESLIGNLAYTFHFPPSELFAMDDDQLKFWHDQAVRIHEGLKT